MGWQCGQCTLQNDGSAKRCVACDAKKRDYVPSMLPACVSLLTGAIQDIFTFDTRETMRDIFGDNGRRRNQAIPPRPPPPAPPVYIPKSVSMPAHLNGDVNLSTSPPPPPRPPPPRNGSKKRVLHSQKSVLCSEVAEQVDQKNSSEAVRTLEEALSMCRTLNTNFVDPEFPPNQSSIGTISKDWAHDADRKFITAISTCVFRRPTEMYTLDGRRYPWSVFCDPQPSDIEQGSLGDCWLLSALALIAERPEILSKIILTPKYIHEGAYLVRLCISGQWKVVIVDDYFPCRPDGSPLFARGRRNQLWPMLVEKALAKVYGSYASLECGQQAEALSILSGSPCTSIQIKEQADVEELWAMLISSRECGFIMGTAITDAQANSKQLEQMGLITAHAYSIIDMTAVNGQRLIRLRNPWGSKVWNGPYSDVWPQWTPELRNKLRPGTIRGSFWMPFETFIGTFDIIDVCKLRENHSWAELRTSLDVGTNTEESNAIRIVVEESTELCIAANSTAHRQDTESADILICLHKINGNERLGELKLRSPRKKLKTTTDDIFLDPGHYVIMVQSLMGKPSAANISIHSSKKIFADIVPFHKNIFHKSLHLLARKHGRPSYFHDGSITYFFLEDKFCGCLLVVENRTNNLWLSTESDFTDSFNVLSSRESLRLQDRIAPGTKQIIVVMTQFDTFQEMRIQCAIKSRLIDVRGITSAVYML